MRNLMKYIFYLFMMCIIIFFAHHSIFGLRRGINYHKSNHVVSLIYNLEKSNCSINKVESILNKNGIYERSFIKGISKLNFEGDYVKNSSGLRSADSMIVALIPDVEASFLDKWNTHLVFIFAKDGRLIRFKAERRAIGL